MKLKKNNRLSTDPKTPPTSGVIFYPNLNAEIMPRFSHFRRPKFLAETFRRRRLKKFAGKNINESAVFCLVKMHRDGGGLNKLHRRIALQHTLGGAHEMGWGALL